MEGDCPGVGSARPSPLAAPTLVGFVWARGPYRRPLLWPAMVFFNALHGTTLPTVPLPLPHTKPRTNPTHGSHLCFGPVKLVQMWSLVGESHASVCVRVLTPP